MQSFQHVRGEKIGELTFLEEVPKKHPSKKRAKFLCKCGQEFPADISHVKSLNTRSCGCSRRRGVIKVRLVRRGFRGLSKSAEYPVWKRMVARCTNPNSDRYKWYGAKGITVCDEWKNSYETFLSDMGCRPSPKHTLDRIDNAKGYAKDNCRWATWMEQHRNRSVNRFFTFRGETLILKDLCKKYNAPYQRTLHRLKINWDIEKALFTPNLR